jgi:phosphoribosylformylglycinamidine (FGAM) synthase-like enzyme
VHDLSDGGLAVALAEMAMVGGIGLVVQSRDLPSSLPVHAFLFGEDQGRYLITVPTADLHQVRQDAQALGIPTWYLGVTGGAALTLGADEPITLSELNDAHESWLPDYMAGPAPELELAA